jgi:hypothetical protein
MLGRAPRRIDSMRDAALAEVKSKHSRIARRLLTAIGYMARFSHPCFVREKRRCIPFRKFDARRAGKRFSVPPIRTNCGTDLGISI